MFVMSFVSVLISAGNSTLEKTLDYVCRSIEDRPTAERLGTAVTAEMGCAVLNSLNIDISNNYISRCMNNSIFWLYKLVNK